MISTSHAPNRKILVTGGHITPAIATIAVLRKRNPGWNFVFVGRVVAMEGTRVKSEERTLIEKLGIRFLPIIAGRLKRDGGLGAVVSLLKVPVGCVQAARYLLTEKPDAVLSFGGYVALPVVLFAALFGVPVITHEQTTNPGLANRIIGRFARKICISFPDTRKAFRDAAGRVEYTGLPVRERVFDPPKAPSFDLPHGRELPILLIVGGSTGSVSINTVVFAALPKLLSRFTVIHQVGRLSLTVAEDVKKNMKKDGAGYVPLPYLSEEDYAWALTHTALVIGRSGANTVTEVALSAKPAIFIPLPWSAGGEQMSNAKVLEQAGSAVILPQERATAGALVDTVDAVMRTISQKNKNAAEFARQVPRDGAARLASVVTALVG